MRVAINTCYGGFSLSSKAYEWLIQNKNWKVTEDSKHENYTNSNADLLLTTHPIYSTRNRLYSPLKFKDENEFRSNSEIIEVVNTLGKEANGPCADISIIEIPDDVNWEIGEYDGREWIQEIPEKVPRKWGLLA
jgi:hypothetical protein